MQFLERRRGSLKRPGVKVKRLQCVGRNVYGIFDQVFIADDQVTASSIRPRVHILAPTAKTCLHESQRMICSKVASKRSLLGRSIPFSVLSQKMGVRHNCVASVPHKHNRGGNVIAGEIVGLYKMSMRIDKESVEVALQFSLARQIHKPNGIFRDLFRRFLHRI
jgi:hypothetical protein